MSKASEKQSAHVCDLQKGIYGKTDVHRSVAPKQMGKNKGEKEGSEEIEDLGSVMYNV